MRKCNECYQALDNDQFTVNYDRRTGAKRINPTCKQCDLSKRGRLINKRRRQQKRMAAFRY